MIRDEDGKLTGYVYVDLRNANYGGFVTAANRQLQSRLKLPPGYTYQWAGEYQFEQRAKQRLSLILPLVLFTIFLLLYLVFHSVTEALVLIFPTIYALSGGLLLQWLLHYNLSVAVAVGYIALFGIAVETGVVMVVYLHETVQDREREGRLQSEEDIEAAAIEGAVHRLRPKLMTVAAVLASLIPILWESGVGSDVMKPIAAPIVGSTPEHPLIVGIDFLEMDPIDGVIFLKKDFTDDDAPQALIDALGGHKVDVVMSDMAAPTTGHRATDHLRIINLVEMAAEFAIDVLAPGGTFIAKVFQGGTEHELLALLKRHFATTLHAKPKASRQESAETYLIARGFKGTGE